MPQRPAETSRELLAISSSLETIIESLRRLVPLFSAPAGELARGQDTGAPRVPSATGQKRKLKVTPARRDALKVQGRYLGLLRGLKPRDRARVKAIAKSQGVSVAVALGQRLSGR
jgi:hypothetical protein